MIVMERGGHGYEFLRPVYCLSLGIEHVYSQSPGYVFRTETLETLNPKPLVVITGLSLGFRV